MSRFSLIIAFCDYSKDSPDRKQQALKRAGKNVQKYVDELIYDENLQSYKYKQMNQYEEGNGPRRIDQNLEPELDMYSMLFTTTMYPEYIYMIKKEIDRKEKAMEDMINAEIKRQENNGD